jgi:hypothetical protein
MYYRVINPLEFQKNPIDSRDFQKYPRKNRASELMQSYKCVCILSEKTNIRISSAIDIAKQYGHIIENIQEKVRNNESSISLDLFLIYDDPIKKIPMTDLVDFINNYNPIYERTGIFIDDGDEPFVWECIWENARNSINPKMPSRLLSCFLFDNLQDAENFKKEEFNLLNKIVKIEIEENRNLCKYDLNWLSDVPVNSTYTEAYHYAENYWQEKETKNPIWEFLCDCIYKPLDIN